MYAFAVFGYGGGRDLLLGSVSLFCFLRQQYLKVLLSELYGTIHRRSEAKATIEALRGMGIRTMIVSGDRAPVVESVGSELGIDETYSHYSPLQKADLVESLVAQGKKVCASCPSSQDAALPACCAKRFW